MSIFRDPLLILRAVMLDPELSVQAHMYQVTTLVFQHKTGPATLSFLI